MLTFGARGFDAKLGWEVGRGLLTALVSPASLPFGEALMGAGLATCFFCPDLEGDLFLVDEFSLAWTCVG